MRWATRREGFPFHGPQKGAPCWYECAVTRCGSNVALIATLRRVHRRRQADPAPGSTAAALDFNISHHGAWVVLALVFDEYVPFVSSSAVGSAACDALRWFRPCFGVGCRLVGVDVTTIENPRGGHWHV